MIATRITIATSTGATAHLATLHLVVKQGEDVDETEADATSDGLAGVPTIEQRIGGAHPEVSEQLGLRGNTHGISTSTLLHCFSHCTIQSGH